MKKLHELVTKRQWFILFNIGTLIAVFWTGRLTSSRADLISSLIALLVINGIALVSARNFPEWK